MSDRTTLAPSTLAFEDVSFRYRRRLPYVLDGFSWHVPEGRTVLLGPNGAGKSTLLALAAAMLQPDTGALRLGDGTGSPATLRDLRSASGWMPQTIGIMPGLTVLEHVRYAAWLKGASGQEADQAAKQALDWVDLADDAARPARRLSGGQRRRLGLAQALAGRPQLLLLDEPTAGLDPEQRSRFRKVLLELSHPVATLVSTHHVDDLDELFDTVAVVHDGHILFSGSPRDFLARNPDAGSRHPAEAAYSAILAGR